MDSQLIASASAPRDFQQGTEGPAFAWPKRLKKFARDIWRNYPVQDDPSFRRYFREHAFEESRVASWVAALGGTALMAHRTLVVPVTSGKPVVDAIASSFWDISLGLLLFWTAPVVFASAVDWSKRNYQWVLAAVFSLRFIRLGGNTLFEYSNPVLATVSALHLSLFASAFLRLPFQVAFCLSMGGYLLTTTACLIHYGALQSISFVVPVSIAIGLGLFASWRSERRERVLFELRHQAEGDANEARVQARNAQEAMTRTMVADQEKEQVLQELKKVHERNRFMIRAFFHDAKQPLVSMGPAARDIELLAFSRREYVDFLPKADTIISSVAEFERLVDGLGRLVAVGDFVPRIEPVSVNALLNFVSRAYSQNAASKKIQFTVVRREPDVYLWTDEVAARSMLKNLVSNAIKYTSRGAVFVGYVKYQDTLRIDVRDSGVGIPADKKDDIYQEFVRLKNPQTSQEEGQGLGLAIVAHFRDKLAGHGVKHHSKFGRGSRFSLTFPLAPKIGLQPVPVDNPFIEPKRVYVVLVGDKDDVRKSMKATLHFAGYDVHNNVKDFPSAAKLRTYLSGADHRAPNIVITDFGLQGEETAEDVLDVLDRSITWEPIPAIVYTKRVMTELPFTRANTHLLTKSHSPQPLIQLMQDAMRESRRDESRD